MKDHAARRRAAIAVRPPQTEDLSREELRRLGKAERKLTSADRAQAAGGRREIQDLERRLTDRLEAQSLAARLAETSALARGRGEEVRSESVRIAVPLVDEHGARIVKSGLPLYRQETVARVRVTSRAGLQLAFDRGDLDGGRLKGERLLETGKAYRWAYETCSALTTPARNLSPISSRSPLRSSAGPQDAVFAAGEILRVFRRDLTARQCAVLDRVCGLDMTVRAAALALKADPRSIRRALVEALIAATESRAASSPPGERAAAS
ncbi:MAG TPA: hypothetical protein VGG29_10935 [Caulobacteraceae bacterium]